MSETNVISLKNRFVPPAVRKIRLEHETFEKGIILPPQCDIDVSNNSIVPNGLTVSPDELRRTVLFWDKAIIPQNNAIGFGSTAEIDFLESCGFLEKPFFSSDGEMASIVAQSYADCFLTLECKDPGKWCTAGERNDLQFTKLDMDKQRGALVKLMRAVPMPNRDIPLAEVFEFKRRRRDELDLLRLEIDGFFDSWLSAEDRDHQLSSTTKRVHVACNELLRSAKESKLSFQLSTLSIGITLSAISAYSLYDGLKNGAFNEELNATVGLLGTLGGGLLMMTERTPKRDHWKSSPYRYAVHMERELL